MLRSMCTTLLPSAGPSADPAWLDLPKVELHIHLDLTASYGAIVSLDPSVTLADYRRRFVGPRRCTDLADFLALTPNYLELQQDERGLRVIVEDLFDQLVRDGVIYAEIRFAPLQHTQGALSARRAVEIVEQATAEAVAATGVEARLLLCSLRHFSAEQSMETARLADAFRGSLVVGLDLAGDEAGFPLDPHVPAFAWAADRGLALTAHAGEGLGAASVRETLDRLAPSRIGHGVRAVEDPAVVALLKERGVHLEACPSSNVQTQMYERYADHPIERLHQAGVSLSVSTDCRSITDVSLGQEYDRLRAAFGWTGADFHRCNVAALEAAFVEDDVRKRLLAALDARRDDSADGPSGSYADGWIQTYTGRRVDPLDPDPTQFEIGDIAQALSNQCRFGGHSRVFYSVAQHSTIVSDLVQERGGSTTDVLAALLHDAGEAYLVDLPHPLKHRSALGPPYRRAEGRLEAAIEERFDVPPMDKAHKPLDRRLLATERSLFTSTAGSWPELDGFEPLDLVIEPWEPARAAREFLQRFEALMAARLAERES
jgi:adenosine deaminase